MTYQPTEQHLEFILHYAGTQVPREACGVIADGEFYPIKNLIDDRNTSFLMDPVEYAKVSSRVKRIEAIVHSHVELSPAASENDRASCNKLGIPFVIVSWPSGQHAVLEPVAGERAPLVGRQWCYGVHDCFSLVRDALDEYAGIDVPDFSREEWQWWKKGGNYIAERFEAAGFVRLPQGTRPTQLDVFGMQIASKVVNHLGVFFEPDVMLHQLQEKLSVREIYGGIYQRATVLHLRHRSLA